MTSKHWQADRRGFLRTLSALGGFGAMTRLGLGGGTGLAVVTARAQGAGVPDRGSHVVLLGTQGGPNFTRDRKECSTAVVIDGRIYLVDCGYGALGNLRESGLGFREVDNIFLTHLHDDHTSDLPALLSHQWTDGRLDTTQIVGPYGTERMVAAALEFARANSEIRLVDEDRSVHPADIFVARDIAAARTPTEVFADDRVTVSSIENTHFPEASTTSYGSPKAATSSSARPSRSKRPGPISNAASQPAPTPTIPRASGNTSSAPTRAPRTPGGWRPKPASARWC
jgi:hypothetical protein